MLEDFVRRVAKLALVITVTTRADGWAAAAAPVRVSGNEVFFTTQCEAAARLNATVPGGGQRPRRPVAVLLTGSVLSFANQIESLWTRIVVPSNAHVFVSFSLHDEDGVLKSGLREGAVRECLDALPAVKGYVISAYTKEAYSRKREADQYPELTVADDLGDADHETRGTPVCGTLPGAGKITTIFAGSHYKRRGKMVHGLNLLSMWLRIAEANQQRELYDARHDIQYVVVVKYERWYSKFYLA